MFLAIIDRVDNFPYTTPESYHTLFSHDGVPLGYIHANIAKYFASHSGFDTKDKSFHIQSQYDTVEKRTKLFEHFGLDLKSRPEFDELLAKGWRNELYTVYNTSSTPYFQVERAFSVLIGVVTYGVHLNGYVPASGSSNGKLKLWVPRRSATKSTFPSMLDNTVAGGLGGPYGIWETLVKESFEEAGLSEEFVTKNAQSAGMVSYIYQTEDERVQPEVEYIYDIRFENETDVIPSPQDGEAQDFTLMDIDEVIERMQNGEFKPNCGMVIVDFLVRHGFINPDTEKDYAEILSRSHRKFPFPSK